MADAAASTLSSIQTIQTALSVLASLQLTTFHYPPNCALTNDTAYDFIIVGGGTAGSVLANRLSANSSVNVLLVEEGAYAPLESDMPGTFTPIPTSEYDYNTYSVNDNRTAQNLQSHSVSLTQGKMLGGSSALDHMIHVQGDPHDFNQWATILEDDRWNYTNVLPYFKKFENLTDPGLLASSYANVHGTYGMVKITREVSPVSTFYLDAFAELGHNIVDDTTSETSSLGFTHPLFTIDDNVRQNNAYGYLGPIKGRSNLCVAISTTATKILVENGVAVGVQVNTSSAETYVLHARKEIIVSAGAVHSPKLLMLSGIGPKSHLESLGISVVADLPVGENFMDHPSAVLVIQMEKTTDAGPPMNPYMFPVPTTTGYVALDSSQTYPDYQVINLVFPPGSAAQLQLCSNVFKYSNNICNRFYAASNGRSTLFVVHNLMMPKSRGKILLASTDPTVEPLVYTGTYSNSSDLELMTKSLADFIKVLETKKFSGVNATLVDTGLCTGLSGSKFWECYALGMSATMWHYAGTCAMGSVVDTELHVKGVSNLRVVDASAMPTEVSGNIKGAISMIAERAAAFILDEWSMA